jgi:HYDIN/CFA65/VesB family protein
MSICMSLWNLHVVEVFLKTRAMRNIPRFSGKFLFLTLIAAGIFFGSQTSTAQRRSYRWSFPSSLRASSSSLNFSTVQAGSSKQISETLTNIGRTSVTISSAKVSGTGFSVNGISTPLTLAAGHSYTFQAVFAPASSGSSSGSIIVTSNAPQVSITLAGTGAGAGALKVTPGIMYFGSLAVGSSKSLTATLSATGSSVVISSAGTNSAEYTMSGINLPLTIAPGKVAYLTLTFKPQSSGAASGTASFTSNASNSSVKETLSGTGTSSGVSGSTPSHNVSLTWKASSSSVAGYNVYRAAKSGGPYTKLNSAADTATLYTDSAVSAGSTYYYVTKAVNSAGTESAASNEVAAVVPTP